MSSKPGPAATVDAGVEFNVRGECPNCGDPVVIVCRVVTVLTRSADDGGSLKLKAKAAKQSHDCGAPQLTITAELARPSTELAGVSATGAQVDA